jgi:guanine nucleotide-binding protein G(i) subunit alpha
MRIIHGTSYTIDERKKYKPLIFHNIIDSINRMVNAMKKFNLKFVHDYNEDNYMLILDCHKSLIESKFDWKQSLEKYSSVIKAIWDDPSIIRVYQRRNEFYLIDSIEL